MPSTKFLSPVTVMVEAHTDPISQTPWWNYNEEDCIANPDWTYSMREIPLFVELSH